MGKEIDYSKYWGKAEPKKISFDYGVFLALSTNTPLSHIGKMMQEICMVELGLMKREEMKAFKNIKSEQLKKYIQAQADKSRREYIKAFVGGKFKNKDLEDLSKEDDKKVTLDDLWRSKSKKENNGSYIDDFFFYWNKVYQCNKGSKDVPEFFKESINNFIGLGLNQDYARLERLILEQKEEFDADKWANFVTENWGKISKIF